MECLKFSKELYSKVALIKAAYNFTDEAYIHLDADTKYYYVNITSKDECSEISNEAFENEILTQSIRHEIYLQTKNVRELMLARAMATSVIASEDVFADDIQPRESFSEDEILKDWFEANE